MYLYRSILRRAKPWTYCYSMNASSGSNHHESQSSSINASTPNADATSDIPLARFSAPRRTYLTNPSSSPDNVSNRVERSSSAYDGAAENDGSNTSLPSAWSTSASVSVSESSSVSLGRGTENPMTFLRCRRCRRLRCRRMLIDRRSMSCVVSPAKVVKNVRKWIHMSKMLSMAFEREDVWSTKGLSDECKS
jgi:hypothetical protein